MRCNNPLNPNDNNIPNTRLEWTKTSKDDKVIKSININPII